MVNIIENVFLFLISLFASSIGAVTGIGGGIIIKPLVDTFGLLPISVISFLSGCTVLSMTCVSLIKSKKAGIKVDIKRTTYLALGGILGGILGKYIFDIILKVYNNENFVGILQASLLLIVTICVVLYMLKKERIKSYQIDNKIVCIISGLILGLISAFLGIGGGPINLVLLYMLFSMDSKTATINSIYIIFFSQISSLIFTIIGGTLPTFSIWNLLSMVSAGIGGGFIGSYILKKINLKQVDKVFTLVLILVSLICLINIYKLL